MPATIKVCLMPGWPHSVSIAETIELNSDDDEEKLSVTEMVKREGKSLYEAVRPLHMHMQMDLRHLVERRLSVSLSLRIASRYIYIVYPPTARRAACPQCPRSPGARARARRPRAPPHRHHRRSWCRTATTQTRGAPWRRCRCRCPCLHERHRAQRRQQRRRERPAAHPRGRSSGSCRRRSLRARRRSRRPVRMRRAVTSLASALRLAAASLAAPAGTLNVECGSSREGATCLAPVCGSKAAPLSC